MRQMCFDELLLNSSISDADAPRLSAQAERIWRLFCPNGTGHYHPVWSTQLAKVALQYCARISEIRHWLRQYNLTIDVTGRSENGNHRYEIREFERSNYQKLLRRKGLV